MIITDCNKLSINELETISKMLNKEYAIENGKITEVKDKKDE